MKIKKAIYIGSYVSWEKCPPATKPEYAFIGRSNVGKSSLINAITNHKSLAKTSEKPGKTQCINQFLINDTFYLTDLPGYGYAKVSKSTKESFQKFTLEYIQHRPNLLCLFLLIDSRHPPQKEDLQFLDICGSNNIPFMICFTKTDKLKKNVLNKNISTYLTKLSENWDPIPDYFLTSAMKKQGLSEILTIINKTNDQFKSKLSL